MAFSRHLWRTLSRSRVAWKERWWACNLHFDWFCVIYVWKLWLLHENVVTLNAARKMFTALKTNWRRCSSEIFTLWSMWPRSLRISLFCLPVEVACRNRRWTSFSSYRQSFFLARISIFLCWLINRLHRITCSCKRGRRILFPRSSDAVAIFSGFHLLRIEVSYKISKKKILITFLAFRDI